MFPALTDAQLARVAAFGIEKSFGPGEVVLERGDSDVPFYVILDGEMEIVHPRGKLEEPVAVHHAKEFSSTISTSR